MSTAPAWKPDTLQSRVWWLHNATFPVAESTAGFEHLTIRARTCYDVIAAPNWCIAAPRQPWSEIWLLRDGEVEVVQDDQRTTVRAGEVAILTGGRSRLSTERRGRPLSLLGFSFDVLLWNAFDFLALLDLPICIQPGAARRDKIQSALQNLIDECKARPPVSTLAAEAWAELAFVEVLRASFPDRSFEELWRTKIPAALSSDITSTLTNIAASFCEPLNLEQLAQQAHLSPKHFSRKFKAAVGVSPMEYVRRMRLEHAQNLLAATDEPIGQVAFRCGFEDAAHFSRAFRDFTNSSPMEFRRHSRAFYTKSEHLYPTR